MRIYLDNCCYNRPYDDQNQMRIHLEAEAKLHIQQMIKAREVDLVTSYALDYENGKNRYEMKRNSIKAFMDEFSSAYVGKEHAAEVEEIAEEIQKTGVKAMDSIHVACAEIAESGYFITTDDRLLKYKTDLLDIVTPGEFIRIWESGQDREPLDDKKENNGSCSTESEREDENE